MIAENVIIYLDIASKAVKKKDINKSIEQFIDEKHKINPNSKFGLFFFNSTNDPVFIADVPNGRAMDKKLDEEWKDREIGLSNFENGLFFCLSELAAQAQKSEAVYRVIVLSDLPSGKNAEYIQALMGLVESVRNFPTFIDIIRIGHERLYKDDVKLRLISTLTNGGLFYVNNPKSLQSVMTGLVKNKTLPDLAPQGGQIIDTDQKKYWLNLAVALIPASHGSSIPCSICNSKVCNYCNSDKDISLVCPNCGTAYHECCAALHSWQKNIGLKHIFRCITCGLLLKMNEKAVYAINQTPFEDELKDVVEETPAESEEESWSPPTEEVEYNQEAQYVPPPENIEAPKTTIPPSTPTQEPTLTPNSNVNGQKVAVKLGMFGPVVQRKVTTSKAEPEFSAPTPKPVKSEAGSNQESALERRKRLRGSNGADGIIVCPVCSTLVKKTPNLIRCPKCNSPI